MLNWLRSLWGLAFGGLSDLWHQFINVIQAVYSWVDGIINDVYSYIYSLWTSLYGFVQQVESWVGSLYNSLAGWVRQIYSDITSWVGRLYSELLSLINQTLAWIGRLYDTLVGWVQSLFSSLVNWVIKNIWDPLYNFISGVYRWVVNEGYYVFYMITHPDQLAKLLGEYILREWLNLGKRYASTISRWLVGVMVSAGHEIGGIISDILAGII